VDNYFNYFTEIEEHFQRRRGSILLLSTLDWALIETWREAGVPLAAVLRGIDDAFDKHDARKAKNTARRVNGLAWCSQAVMAATEDMREATVGTNTACAEENAENGFEDSRVRAHLLRCATDLRAAKLDAAPVAAQVAKDIATRLDALESELTAVPQKLETLDRTLTGLEEKMFAALLTALPEERIGPVREQAARELAPYRSRMAATQIRQVEHQFLQKRLLEQLNLPRLSLFYMAHE
jgi:hypothetical protein